jgi:hypothetical protein
MEYAFYSSGLADQHNLFVYNLWGDPSLYWPGNPGIQEDNTLLTSVFTPILKITPNLVINRATIQYTISVESNVTLKIYDASGRVVKTITNSKEKAGTYTKHWDGKTEKGTKATAGIYFCRLETDKSILTQKLTLLR